MSTAVDRHRFDILAAGRRLRVERLEPLEAAGPTLVFLHEGLGSIAQWKDFPARLCLACGLPGLVYERWGFGESEPLTEPRAANYLQYEAHESLPAVLAACGVRERPIFIGHSDGGTIALLFAAIYPKRPLAIITEAAHVYVEEVTLAGIRIVKHLYETTDLPRRLARFHGANTDAMFRGWCDTWLGPDFRDWNMTAELKKITCPALLIQGENDEYATPSHLATIAAGIAGPVETLLLPECAHVPHHQARERTLVAMEGFIGKVVDGSPDLAAD